MNPLNPTVSLSTFAAQNFPSNSTAETRPNKTFDSSERAARLKQLLFDLSKEEDYKDYRSILRSAADSVRIKAFGYNRAVTKRKILKLLSEFYNLEIVDLVEDTGIAEKEIKAAVADLIAEEKITEGERRRYQEPGKHYNKIYELKK